MSPTHAEKSGAVAVTPPVASGVFESLGSGDGESLGSGDSEGSGDGLGSGLTETDRVGEGRAEFDENRCGAAFAMVPAIRTAANVVRVTLRIFMPSLSAQEVVNLDQVFRYLEVGKS